MCAFSFSHESRRAEIIKIKGFYNEIYEGLRFRSTKASRCSCCCWKFFQRQTYNLLQSLCWCWQVNLAKFVEIASWWIFMGQRVTAQRESSWSRKFLLFEKVTLHKRLLFTFMLLLQHGWKLFAKGAESQQKWNSFRDKKSLPSITNFHQPIPSAHRNKILRFSFNFHFHWHDECSLV